MSTQATWAPEVPAVNDDMLPRRPEEATQALDGALERTDLAIAEGRDAIQCLRTIHNELAQAVTVLGNEMRRELALQDSAYGPAGSMW
jgi:hypothetical protein